MILLRDMRRPTIRSLTIVYIGSFHLFLFLSRVVTWLLGCIFILFDPRPKESRRELFDREKELKILEEFVEKGSPIILCLGVRRIGKTSLLKTFLNESGYPYIFINARKLSEYGYSIAGLYRVFSEAIAQTNVFNRIIDYLKGLRGINITVSGVGLGIEFNWRRREPSITSILERLDHYAKDRETYFLVTIDEAQELRFLKGFNKIDFREIMAYSYDNLRNIKFILSGSEIGLLYDFLEFNNYSSPLYGRVRDELIIERFSKEESIRFLEKGFEEAGMKPSKEVIEKAVDLLDGIPGWLSFYGYKAVQMKNFDIIDKVLEEAIQTALDELNKIIKAGKYYRHILRAIAMGYKNWSLIKRSVETWTGSHVNNKILYNNLVRLINLTILSKENDRYDFIDNIYREAAKRI